MTQKKRRSLPSTESWKPISYKYSKVSQQTDLLIKESKVFSRINSDKLLCLQADSQNVLGAEIKLKKMYSEGKCVSEKTAWKCKTKLECKSSPPVLCSSRFPIHLITETNFAANNTKQISLVRCSLFRCSQNFYLLFLNWINKLLARN